MRVGSVLFLKQSVDAVPCAGNQSQAAGTFSPVSPALVEILGEPVLHRMIESLRRSNVDPVFVVADERFRTHPAIRTLSRERIHVLTASENNLCGRLETAVKRCGEAGADSVVVMEAGPYVELDVADLVHAHQSNRGRATLVHDSEGPLPIVMVSSNDGEFAASLLGKRLLFPEATTRYCHNAYVNRLRSARDFRLLAQDSLEHRCRIRPNGDEIAPGVWVANSARIHASARVIGPAYVGPNSRLRAGTVVSDCSTVERDCIVERGSVVADSSILSGTYLGACLDLRHSMVWQNNFVDLERNVEIRMLDNLMGATSLSSRQRSDGLSAEAAKSGDSAPRSVSERLRTLLTRREYPVAVPVPARVAYSSTDRWSSLKPLSGTTDSTGI